MKQRIMYPSVIHIHLCRAMGWKIPHTLVVQTDDKGRHPQYGTMAPRV